MPKAGTFAMAAMVAGAASAESQSFGIFGSPPTFGQPLTPIQTTWPVGPAATNTVFQNYTPHPHHGRAMSQSAAASGDMGSGLGSAAASTCTGETSTVTVTASADTCTDETEAPTAAMSAPATAAASSAAMSTEVDTTVTSTVVSAATSTVLSEINLTWSQAMTSTIQSTVTSTVSVLGASNTSSTSTDTAPYTIMLPPTQSVYNHTTLFTGFPVTSTNAALSQAMSTGATNVTFTSMLNTTIAVPAPTAMNTQSIQLSNGVANARAPGIFKVIAAFL